MRIPEFRFAVVFSAGMAIGIALTALGLSGCSGKSGGKVVSSDDADPDEDAAPVDPEDKASDVPKTGKGNKKKGKGDKIAHIGEIPIDVWPEVWLKQPLSVAAESGAAAAPVE